MKFPVKAAVFSALFIRSAFATTSETTLEVVYASSPFPKLETSALSSTVVITREDIQASGATDLTGVLRRRADIHFTNAGGRGNESNIYLRGTNEDHVLVLLNNTRLGSASSGEIGLSRIPIELVERIEIIKGPQSSLHGPDAMGGVIAIYTKTQGDNQVSVQLGNHNTAGLTGFTSTASGPWSMHATVSKFRTSGFDVRSNGDPDNDGLEQESLDFGIQRGNQDDGLIRFQFYQANSDIEYDGSGITDYYINNRVDQTLGISGSKRLNSSQQIKVDVNQVIDNNRPHKNGLPDNRYKTTRHSVTSFLEHQFSTRSAVQLGIDWSTEELESNITYDQTKRDNLGLILGGNHLEGPWLAELMMRADENQQFGRSNSYHAGIGYRFDSTSIGLRFAKAVNTPSFNQLYYPTTYIGNPNLEPETAKTTELWIRGNRKNLTFETVFFETELEDLIEPVFGAMYEQIDSAKIQGIEQSIGYDWSRGGTELTIAYLSAKERDGTRLPYRPRLKSGLAGYFGITDAIEITGAVTAVQGHTTGRTLSGDDRLINSCQLIDLGIGYQINNALSSSVKVDNVFDRKGFNRATRRANYPFASRTVTASLDYRF